MGPDGFLNGCSAKLPCFAGSFARLTGTGLSGMLSPRAKDLTYLEISLREIPPT